MTDRYPKRLIEVDLPIKRISAHARREKSIRHGHISTLHIWWARRPLAACRAVLCASLWPDPADELCPPAFRQAAALAMQAFAFTAAENRQVADLCNPVTWGKLAALRQPEGALDPANPAHLNFLRFLLLDFIADFANWDASTVPAYLETARLLTHVAHLSLSDPTFQLPATAPDESLQSKIRNLKSKIENLPRPLVVDPFAGGGAIPLEALRVGADAFASDLNPVAVLLNKVVLEYIPKYGQRLADEVRKWGEWLQAEAKKALREFYPLDSDGSEPIGYLWARTIICEGPNCGVTVPIIRNQLISSGRGTDAAIKFGYSAGELRTRVVRGKEASEVLGGTSKRSSVTCPSCGYTTPRTRVEAQANERGFGYHMLAVCLRDATGQRTYRQPTVRDHAILEASDEALRRWLTSDFGGIPAIPAEELPYLRSIFNVRVYGIDQWHKLYHRRQLLSALTFTQIVRRAAREIQNQLKDSGFAAAVTECLALSVSNSFQYQCNIATYLTEGIKSAFIQGQSLPMKMDFIEANPLMADLAGGYSYSLDQHVSGLTYAASFPYQMGVAQQVSALKGVLPQDAADLLATDPPYYDVVPYADCSDFFFVWLRRMLHGITDFPTTDELTPKDEEIVQLAERNERYRARTKHWFEDKMCQALTVARATVRPSGIGMIVFAHKGTAAWEALLQSVLDAGWVVTGSWPVHTESETRLRAKDSAVLSSSIHLVCRPRETASGALDETPIGEWREVLDELPGRIHDWMPRLAQEGVVGADAIFACLGPALEIYSRYARVEKASGEQVTLKEYLEQVWAAVAREAMTMIFEGGDATGFEEDARLTAMWLWTLSTGSGDNGGRAADAEEEGDEEEGVSGKAALKGGYVLEYDAARKIAQGLGAHLERLASLVEIKGDKARLLPVAERTRTLFGKEGASEPTRRRGVEQLSFLTEVGVAQEPGSLGELGATPPGATVLDRVHQAMLLFAAGRGEALRRFLVEDGAGQDRRLWRLAQALSALYPARSDEKRWVDGVLGRKKGLGF